MLQTMAAGGARSLNDSGEDGLSRIFDQGALHWSRGQSTSSHAHNAWKLHIGLDAPVWMRSEGGATGEARVAVFPPGFVHETGALGWSLAVFLAPGSRGMPWRHPAGGFALRGALAERVVALGLEFDVAEREATADFADDLASAVGDSLDGVRGIDRRVEAALRELRADPNLGLFMLARRVGLSLDRLSRLVAEDTGLGLRRHVLWNKVVGFLSSSQEYQTLAAAAVANGFSDHAHMTRSCRQFLGRVPSDFKAPPDVAGKW